MKSPWEITNFAEALVGLREGAQARIKKALAMRGRRAEGQFPKKNLGFTMELR